MKATSEESKRISSFLAAVYRETDLSKLSNVVVAEFARLIRADAVGVTVVYTDGQIDIVQNAPDLSKILEERVWALGAYLHQHPLEMYSRETGRSDAICISDFLSQRQFRETDLYQEFFRHVGTAYQLGSYLEQVSEFRIGVSFNRRSTDFNASEREILNHLGPHVLQAYKNAVSFKELRECSLGWEAAAAAYGKGFIATDQAFRVKHISALASELLERYFDHHYSVRRCIPELMRDWLIRACTTQTAVNLRRLPLIVAKTDRKLVVQAVQQENAWNILLAERQIAPSVLNLAPLGLSKRENEVLLWVSQGKSNPEIATILGISERTVQKHNERIFAKLDVENRNAAAMIALALVKEM